MTANSKAEVSVATPDADATDSGKDAKTTPARSRSGSSGGTKYLNTTNGPLVYSKDGHQVDAHGWTPEVHLDDVGKAARKAGHLLPTSAL